MSEFKITRKKPFLKRFLELLIERELELEYKIKITTHLPKRIFIMETLKTNRTLQATITKELRGY